MPQLAPFRGLWFKPLIPDSEAITVHGILPNLSTANQSAFGYLSTLKYTPVRYIKVADSCFFFFCLAVVFMSIYLFLEGQHAILFFGFLGRSCSCIYLEAIITLLCKTVS